MKRPKLKKIVSKKIKSGKRLVKRSKKSTVNKDYAEMLIHNEEKTVDSETLIKEAQRRVSNSIIIVLNILRLRITLRNFYVIMLILG